MLSKAFFKRLPNQTYSTRTESLKSEIELSKVRCQELQRQYHQSVVELNSLQNKLKALEPAPSEARDSARMDYSDRVSPDPGII